MISRTGSGSTSRGAVRDGQERASWSVWGISKVCLEEGNFGAICEWASALPRIALVTKSWGALRA
jgi:hypothetical protein